MKIGMSRTKKIFSFLFIGQDPSKQKRKREKHLLEIINYEILISETTAQSPKPEDKPDGNVLSKIDETDKRSSKKEEKSSATLLQGKVLF